MTEPTGEEPTTYDGVIEVPFNPEDQGVFGLAAERVWRFLASRYIDESIGNTTGPINLVTIGAGFPLQAQMQRLEYMKRCDIIARDVEHKLNNRIMTLGGGKLKRVLGVEAITSGWLAGAQQTMSRQRPIVRAAITDTLFNPPATFPFDRETSLQLRNHYEKALANTDKRYVRDHELDIAPGEGGWETLRVEPLGTTLLYELMPVFGDTERTRKFIGYLAGQLTDLTQSQLRSFQVMSLDWRNPDDLMAAAQAALDHPSIFDTRLVQRAARFEDHYQQSHPFDLSMVGDQTVTCMLVSHWPRYDDVFHETGDARVSPMNFIIELRRVMQAGGTVVFLPWQLPTEMVQKRPSFILGQAEEILMQDGFEVRAKADTAAAVIKAAASYGREAMALSPQLRAAGHIITLAATKRLYTLAERLDV